MGPRRTQKGARRDRNAGVLPISGSLVKRGCSLQSLQGRLPQIARRALSGMKAARRAYASLSRPAFVSAAAGLPTIVPVADGQAGASRLQRRICGTVAHTPIETNPLDVHAPFARYVHACSVPPDVRLLFTSGQLGIDVEGSIPLGAEAQTALALRNVSAILASAGAGLEHIVRLNAYVTGREHLSGYMRARGIPQ